MPQSPQYMNAANVGGALVGQGFPRPSSGGFDGIRKSSYKQNGGRVMDGRQAARRRRKPYGDGAAASRRRTVGWDLLRRARRLAHIAPGYVRRRCVRRRFCQAGGPRSSIAEGAANATNLLTIKMGAE